MNTKPIFTYSKITKMPTTTHKFKFKNIPYHIGLHYIHALEHIPIPYFRLKNTTHPVSYGTSTLISCECEIFGRSDNIRMFTDRPNESQIVVFLSEGIPYINIHLIVSHNTEGHRLIMICTYYRTPRLVYMHLRPLLEALSLLQDKYLAICGKDDTNLNTYRRMILSSYPQQQ